MGDSRDLSREASRLAAGFPSSFGISSAGSLLLETVLIDEPRAYPFSASYLSHKTSKMVQAIDRSISMRRLRMSILL